MAIGLTRSKNLSESNLNLKTALQKLYAPGIENDIELYSLSSSVESICFSGLTDNEDIQIYGLSTESLGTLSGSVVKRTKFSTKYFTFTDENEVYFTKYAPGVGNNTAVTPPRYSLSGSVPSAELISGGGGFYFLDSQNQVINSNGSDVLLSNVELKGKTSGSTSLRANVTFGEQSFNYLPGVEATYTNANLGNATIASITLSSHGLSTGTSIYIRVTSGTLRSGFVSSITVTGVNTFSVSLPSTSANTNQTCSVCSVEELTRFTTGIGSRYSVKSITITDPGNNYVIPEELELIESNANDSSTGQVVKITKQRGAFFEGAPEIIRTKVFTYTVKNSTEEGFFLFDEEKKQYLFLDKNTPSSGLLSSQEVELRRFDGSNISNLLQFKFAQSTIYLRGYDSYQFSLGDSISGAINDVSDVASKLKLRTRLSVQNTKRPTKATSDENVLGYSYNSFSGTDVIIYQRVVLRDQDYILDPTNTDITGSRLKSSVSEFVLESLSSPGLQIRVPGLFIKVGSDYRRAFSTTDKPFFQQITSSSGLKVIANPTLTGSGASFTGQSFGALSAESTLTETDPAITNWHSYNSTISELAQRINTDGVNGAFYFHRQTPPVVTSVSVKRNNVNATIYAVPLFTLAS